VRRWRVDGSGRGARGARERVERVDQQPSHLHTMQA
jgi:hypothetical protein